MKKRKKIIIFVVVVLILLGAYFIAVNFCGENQEDMQYEEYIPQEEISQEQYRETIVNLYFLNKETKQIMAEAVAIDAKTLSNNPYKKLIELLLEGPKNEDLERIIPEGTIVYDASLEAGSVIINFSKEFLNFGEDESVQNNMINSICQTLTELTEVNSIRILIEGEECSKFPDIYGSII